MKRFFILFVLLTSAALAEPICDVRLGDSTGVKVIEFASGNVIHSKIALKEMSSDTLTEEMTNLQDMGVCAEQTIAKKCILKFEKRPNSNVLTLYRGQEKWITWMISAKKNAQDFVVHLKRAGFCS
jgi:hypothetical protein